MKLHIIKALNMSLAIKKMQETLGSQALIYKTRHTELGVEVLAGLGELSEESTFYEASADDVAGFFGKSARVGMESKIAEMNAYIQDMSEKIRVLTRTGDHEPNFVSVQNAYYPVIAQYGFSKRAYDFIFASSLKRAVTIPNINNFIWKRLEKCLKINKYELIDQSGFCAIVGPTGVGKTTTLVKMASRFVRRYGAESLGIITTDPGDRDIKNLLTYYCGQWGVDLEYAHSMRDLNHSVESMRDKKLVLIDTYGVSQNDYHSINELIRLLQACQKKVSVYLALPAEHQEEVLEDIVSRFKFKGLSGCILTKCDEAHTMTPVLSTVIRHALPIAYLCNGQQIETDIHYPSKAMLISKVLLLKQDYAEEHSSFKKINYRPEPMWVLGRGLIQ